MPGFKVKYDDIIMQRSARIRDRGIGIPVVSVIDKVTGEKGKYTITNKETGNSANIYADNIFQFLDGIKKQSGTLFNKTQKSLTEGLDSFGKGIMNKLTTKQ